jgi:hypothetical protein
MVEKRNADYLEITRRLEFPIDAPTLSSVEEEQLVSVSASIFESDVLIWLVGPHHGLIVCFLLTDSLGRFVFYESAPPMFLQPQKKISIIESIFLTPRSASSLATTCYLTIETHSWSMTKKDV